MLLPSRYYEIVENQPGSVLLETARFDQDNQKSYLFTDPVGELSVTELARIPELFRDIEECLREGLFVAGFVSYECGFHFEPTAQRLPVMASSLPLAWFGVYEQPFIFDHRLGRFEPELPADYETLASAATRTTESPLWNSRLLISEAEYRAQVERVLAYITAGDTYQINFTSRLHFDFDGQSTELMARLRSQQRASYAAFLNLGSQRVLSLSPELFFRIKERHVTMRPMKGTARRGVNADEDLHIREWLHNDVKNRSENVMIVDLVRNDVGRVAEMGTVSATDLFAVEKYDTLFQMTSTVTATLKPTTRFYDLFRAAFPCGSITGAPKVRSMQIIQELESTPRGIYTGSIGYFGPNRDAVFNVAIRTVVLEGQRGELGIGGGIVADSDPLQEYQECLLKGKFLQKQAPDYELLESIRWEGKYCLLDLHMDRMCASAEYFGVPWDRLKVLRALTKIAKELRPGTAYKVRLLVNREGTPFAEATLISNADSLGRVALSATRTSSEDRFLYHKTTCRSLYDEMYRQALRMGYDDVLFLNERDELTEGCIHNLFVEISGDLFTPPAESGLLPGVLRRKMLSEGPSVSERVLYLDDLRNADAIYLANSVRGLRQVVFVDRELSVKQPEIMLGILSDTSAPLQVSSGDGAPNHGFECREASC